MNLIPHPITTKFRYSDFYCGAGGSSSGLKKAGIEGEVASNHWQLALDTHLSNHPEVNHVLVDLLISSPAAFPYTDIAWFSPECTKHSRGQGKKRKNRTQLDFLSATNPDPSAERSRVTMWDVVRFSEYHRYQVVIVENVVDVRDWEPYQHWLKAMVSLGYNYKECFFNSRFFHPLNGQTNYSPQNRDRLYVVFWRKGNREPNLHFRPLAYCADCGKDVRAMQVFKKSVPSTGEVLYDTTGRRGQYYYACPTCFSIKDKKPVARRVEPYYFAAYNIIDWSLPCPLIGERKKPLKPKTMNRIRIGLDRFGRQPLVIQMAYNHSRYHHSATMDGVIPTLTKWQTQALCTPFMINTSYGGNGGDHINPIDNPLPAQATRQSLAFILPFKGEDRYQHLKPSAEVWPTQTTSGTPAVIVAPALTEFYGNGNMRPITDVLNSETAGGIKTGLLMSHYSRDNVVSHLSDPCPALVADGHVNLITPPFIVGYYRRDQTASGLNDPIPTIPGENRFGLVTPPFLTSYYNGSDVVHGIDEPIYTVTTNDRHPLVMPGVDTKWPEVAINECGFRMLEPEECKLGQGFDRGYIILGNCKKDKVKQIGNAVSDPVAEFLGNAVKESLK